MPRECQEEEEEWRVYKEEEVEKAFPCSLTHFAFNQFQLCISSNSFGKR